jgi:large subunit ribosomal protein L29
VPQLKAKDLRKLKDEELLERLKELRVELADLKGKAERGLLKKETGDIRVVRRNIAKILTVLNERKRGIKE